MKTNLLKAFAIAIAMTSLINCSVEPTDQVSQSLEIEQSVSQQVVEEATCNGQSPRARLTNNGTIVLNFRIYSLDGTLLGAEGNLDPGDTTEWKIFPAGQALFSVTAIDFNGEKISHIMDFCKEVSLEIDLNNQFTTALPQDATN